MALTEPSTRWQKVIRQTVRRARWGYLLRGACLGWLVGATLSVLLLALAWALQWDVHYGYPAGVTFAGALAGLLFGVMRRLSEAQVALWLDRQAHLQERLSTAHWLSQRERQEAFEQLQMQDAESHAQSIDMHRLARVALPRTFWGALAVSALAVFLWFAPDLVWFQSPQTQQQKQAMRQAGERAEQLAKEWRKQATGQDRERMRRLAARLDALAKQMKRARLSKREALVRLSRLQREAEEYQRRLAQANSGKPLQRAANEFLSARTVQQQIQQAKLERELGARLQTASLKAKAGANAQAPLRNAVQNKSLSSTPFANEMAMQMALALSQQDAHKLGELLKEIAKQWNNLSPEERKKLEELLRQLAKALQGTNLDTASKELLEALKNLKIGDLQKAVQWMHKAGGT